MHASSSSSVHTITITPAPWTSPRGDNLMGRAQRRTRSMRREAAAFLRSGVLFVLVLVLRSCACVGATASTSWPGFKAHGKAAAGGEEGAVSTQRGAGHPAGADANYNKADAGHKVHLGLPGKYDCTAEHTACRASHHNPDGLYTVWENRFWRTRRAGRGNLLWQDGMHMHVICEYLVCTSEARRLVVDVRGGEPAVGRRQDAKRSKDCCCCLVARRACG